MDGTGRTTHASAVRDVADALGAAMARTVLGLMSGTSLDGVDLALVALDGSTVGPVPLSQRLLAFETVPIPPPLLASLRELLSASSSADSRCDDTLRCVCRTNTEWSRQVGAAVVAFLARHGAAPADVVLGSHGQTVWHDPGHSTLQIGDTEVLAHVTGCTVVGNFRAADVAVGGCGAPLVAFYDRAVIGPAVLPAVRRRLGVGSDGPVVIALQNLGGIGNVTLLRCSGDTVTCSGAWDTGPANVVLNEAVTYVHSAPMLHALQARGVLPGVGLPAWRAALRTALPHDDEEAAATFDVGGLYSSNGAVMEATLQRWLGHPFFADPAVTTTGREAFGRGFVAPTLEHCVDAAAGTDSTGDLSDLGAVAARACNVLSDVAATAVALTAAAIDLVYRRHLGHDDAAVAVLVSGGGARSPTLMAAIDRALHETLGSVAVCPLSDLYAVPGLQGAAVDDAKEALAFAVLAHERLNRVPTNEPVVTGAERAVSLGQISAP